MTRILGKYYVCRMQDSTYQIVFRPRAKDGVFIAYGPWDYDKCGWWLRMINNHIQRGDALDISRHEAKRFETNKPK